MFLLMAVRIYYGMMQQIVGHLTQNVDLTTNAINSDSAFKIDGTSVLTKTELASSLQQQQDL